MSSQATRLPLQRRGSQKNEKKACQLFQDLPKPGANHKKSLDGLLAFQVKTMFHTQNPSTLQPHEKEIPFTICLL
jgi:hypothetical protein